MPSETAADATAEITANAATAPTGRLLAEMPDTTPALAIEPNTPSERSNRLKPLNV
jgi:hypothetical protein